MTRLGLRPLPLLALFTFAVVLRDDQASGRAASHSRQYTLAIRKGQDSLSEQAILCPSPSFETGDVVALQSIELSPVRPASRSRIRINTLCTPTDDPSPLTLS